MTPEMEMTFTLNGRQVRTSAPAHMAALELIRDRLGLLGTKLACGEGECGACAILLDGEPVLGCLTPALDLDGRRVVTVEGLTEDGDLSRLQKAFVEEGAVQCGFCTPGMLISAAALLAGGARPSRAQIARGIEGNLCRCTGYTAILEAIERAAREGNGRA